MSNNKTEKMIKPAKESPKGIFRQKSLDTIATPKALTEPIRVCRPGFLLLVAAAAVLLAGFLVWIFVGYPAMTGEPVNLTRLQGLLSETISRR